MDFEQARTYILEHLDIIKPRLLSNGGGSKEHNVSILKNSLYSSEELERLSAIKHLPLETFLEVFSEINELEIIRVKFQNTTSLNLYIFFPKEHNIYTISNLLQPKSYFSNFTALSFNQLIKDKSNTIYLKREARFPSDRNENINQKRIDIAFTVPPKATDKIARFKWNNTEYKIVLLEGLKLINRGLHFQEVGNAHFSSLHFSNIERTLIDCVIRPIYSGGIQSILNAFLEAKSDLNIHLMCELMNEYNMTYPYERSIALYMKKAQYPAKDIALFLEGIDYDDVPYDFYLDYQMIEKKYDEKLKIYYPSWLDDTIE